MDKYSNNPKLLLQEFRKGYRFYRSPNIRNFIDEKDQVKHGRNGIVVKINEPCVFEYFEQRIEDIENQQEREYHRRVIEEFSRILKLDLGDITNKIVLQSYLYQIPRTIEPIEVIPGVKLIDLIQKELEEANKEDEFQINSFVRTINSPVLIYTKDLLHKLIDFNPQTTRKRRRNILSNLIPDLLPIPTLVPIPIRRQSS